MSTDWKLQFALRPEHLFIGPRRCGKSSIVAALHERGYWAHEITTETGEEAIRIYASQRRKYEQDPGSKLLPRMFFSDTAWWHYHARFHYVNPHLRAEISFPEAELEKLLPERGVDWLYRFGGDARERLIPELAVEVDNHIRNGAPESLAARRAGASFMEAHYPELLPVLVYAVPQGLDRPTLRMSRATFEARVRSFRKHYPLPEGLSSQNLVEYLTAVGILEFVNSYFLRFAPVYASGTQELKKVLTHDAIRAKLKGR